jgi:hypothetical protein
MADHAEASWHELQLLVHIFTQLLRVPATRWAICRRRQVHCFITWQVLGQRLARRPLTRRAIGRRHFPFGLGVVSPQVFKLQSKLLDLLVQLLGLATELHAPQFRDPQLQMPDLSSTRVQLRLQSHVLPVACHQQYLQGIDVVEERGGGQYGLSLREAANACMADIGRPLRSGPRQSIPSSCIDSCDCVMETLPLFPCGNRRNPA